jgi:Ca2+-binding RTX toxin-like protein
MATVTYSWNQDFDFQNKVVNTTTAGAQNNPSLAGLADGRFIATWTDPANSGDVRGRILNSDSTPGTATDFLAHPASANSQVDASVAARPALGAAVVAYVDTTLDPNGDVRWEIITPAGVAIANGPVAVDARQEIAPDVASLVDGGFVVSWVRSVAGSDDSRIVRKVFNADGSVRSTPTDADGERVVSATSVHTENTSVAGLAGGEFVVVYEQRPIGGGDKEVYFHRYDAAGAELDDNPVLIDTTGSVNEDIQIIGLQDGGFVVAYTDNEFGTGTDIHARIYDANGSERIDLGRINNFTANAQDKPTLALLSNGYFVVGWQNQGLLKVQAFDPDGNEIGLENDQGGMLGEAEIAGLADGRLVNVRTSSASDIFPGSSISIRASASDLVRTTFGDATNETLVGDGLIDVISGGGGRDNMSGGGANDTLNGGTGRDTVSGGVGSDSIAGGSSGDVLDGGRGTDTVAGGIGDDRVGGAQGQDQLTGNAGADTYNFAALSHSGVTAATRDVITDFEDGFDQIDVSGIDAVAGGTDDPFMFGGPFTAGHIRARQSGADTILRFNTDADIKAEMTILLKNVLVGALDADVFVL